MKLTDNALVCEVCNRRIEVEMSASSSVFNEPAVSPKNSERGRRAKEAGEAGEDVALLVLQQYFSFIRKIETGWGIRRENGRVVEAWPLKSVPGDFRAVYPSSGQSVLIEVKSHDRNCNLTWSDFREHQPDDLDEHAAAGGLSLVVWVRPQDCHILDWLKMRAYGFAKYHPLKKSDIDVVIWEDHQS